MIHVDCRDKPTEADVHVSAQLLVSTQTMFSLQPCSLPTFTAKEWTDYEAEGQTYVYAPTPFKTVGGVQGVWVRNVKGEGNCKFRAESNGIAEFARDNPDYIPVFLAKISRIEHVFKDEHMNSVQRFKSLLGTQDLVFALESDKHLDLAGVMIVRCIYADYLLTNLDEIVPDSDRQDTWRDILEEHLRLTNFTADNQNITWTMNQVCTPSTCHLARVAR